MFLRSFLSFGRQQPPQHPAIIYSTLALFSININSINVSQVFRPLMKDGAQTRFHCRRSWQMLEQDLYGNCSPHSVLSVLVSALRGRAPRRPLGVSTVTSPGRSTKRDKKKNPSRKEVKMEEAEKRISSAQVWSTRLVAVAQAL